MNEILTGLTAYSITMIILWLFSHEDEKVREIWKKPFGIFIRMGALFLLLHLFLYNLPFETWKCYLFLVTITLASFISLFLTIDLLALVILAWAIYQWAFWFPIKDEMILTTQVKKEKQLTVSPLGDGIASTDLKPIGKVIFEGKEHIAISTLGFITAGDKVRIEGSNGTELKVRKGTMSEDQTSST